MTSDPIGLAGGINTYAYVLNNPLYWIDSFGLEIFQHLFPATTAYTSRNPIGGSAEAQLQYAEKVNALRGFNATLAYGAVLGPNATALAGRGTIATCGTIIKNKDKIKKGARDAACAAGFTAACLQGDLDQLGDIADHLETKRSTYNEANRRKIPWTHLRKRR